MATIKKSRQNLVRLAAEILDPLGFTRAGSSLVRERDCCYQIINFQGSSYGGATYMNQMVWFKALGPLPSPINSGTFHFSSRMESRTSEEPNWRSVLEVSGSDTDRTTWKEQVAALLSTGLPDFELLLTPSEARANHLARRVSGLLLPTVSGAGANNSFKPSPLRGLGQNPPFSGGPA